MLSQQVISALQHAADRIGRNNYQSQLREHIKKGRKPNTFRFTVTYEHKEICQALGKIDSLTNDEAMGLLHQYDTMKQMLG